MNVRAKVGFSLIELLTVIAIIGIMTGILIPVTNHVRVTVHRSNSASNLRQIGIALHMYANDNEGWLPETSHTGDTRISWIYTLSSYLDNVDDVRICPMDPQAEERLAQRLSSYIVNEYLFVDRTDPFGGIQESFRNLETLQVPSQTMAVFIGADDLPLSDYNDHTHSRRGPWSNWGAVLADIQPDRFRVGAPAPDRTEGTSNYLYADGHVAVIHAAEIKRRVDAGENIAEPPEIRRQ